MLALSRLDFLRSIPTTVMLNAVRFRGTGVVRGIHDEGCDQVHAYGVVVVVGHGERRVSDLDQVRDQTGLVLEALVVLGHRVPVRGVRLDEHIAAFQVLLTREQVVVVLIEHRVDTEFHGRAFLLSRSPHLEAFLRLRVVDEGCCACTD